MNKKERTFDWRPVFDERSRAYSVRSMLRSKKIDRIPTYWQEGTVLDQGSEGACVGFGWMADILSAPMQPDSQPDQQFGNSLAHYYYREAKKNDEWPGEDYEGTSVLAGAKIMRRYGFISAYRWCFSIDDVIDAVVSSGPVVLGVPWYSSMYETGHGDIVSISGKKVGGHCITITGYDPAMRVGRQTLEVFRWRNSWGEDYGNGGSAYIRVDDLQKLLSDQGEACLPLFRQKPVLEYPPMFQKSIKQYLFRKWFDYMMLLIKKYLIK